MNNVSDDYTFKDKWKIWCHALKDTNWNIDSYNQIYDINNIFDYSIVKEEINKTYYQNTMFFFMRNDILPIWEAPENKNGSTLSFKITKNIKNNIDELLYNIFKEYIYIEESKSLINGVSISPKKEFVIVKLWSEKKINKLSDICITLSYQFGSKNCIIKNTS